MKAVREAVKSLGPTLQTAAICDQMETALRQTLRDYYLQRAADAFFEQFVKRGLEADGSKVPGN